MEPKEYQIKTLDRVKQYLDLLYDWRQKNADIIRDYGPDSALDFPAKAWAKVDGLYAPYTSRTDGLGRPLPCFCLKIPTGGGKTFLAVKTIDLINTNYLKKRTGLVLWVVPTTQIYRQTLKALRDRDHPYRQHLDIASAGRTLILEKGDNFSPLDVRENLIVFMLMLPSANRKTKEVLRMFKDSGGFTEFFPSEDDLEANVRLLENVPNLSMLEQKDLAQTAAFSEDQSKVLDLKETLQLKPGALTLDPVFLARHLIDIVPNPWVAYEFGKTVLDNLRQRYDEKIVVNNFVFIIEEIRKHLAKEKDRLAEHVFRDMISKDQMHFLVVDESEWQDRFNALFAP